MHMKMMGRLDKIRWCCDYDNPGRQSNAGRLAPNSKKAHRKAMRHSLRQVEKKSWQNEV